MAETIQEYLVKLGRQYFVYVLFTDFGIPFYVGVGSHVSRPYDHIRSAKRYRGGRKASIIRTVIRRGNEVPVVIVRMYVTKQEAWETEVALINVIGRWPDGPLSNRSRGGDQPHDIPYWRGKHRPQDTKDKISAAILGRKNGPPSVETRIKISNALMGIKRPPHTENQKANLSAKAKMSWNDPNIRAKRTGMMGKVHSEETKEKMRQGALRRTDLYAIGIRLAEFNRMQRSASHG